MRWFPIVAEFEICGNVEMELGIGLVVIPYSAHLFSSWESDTFEVGSMFKSTPF